MIMIQHKPFIRPNDVRQVATLEYRIDFDLLHEILFTGSLPLPAWLTNAQVYEDPVFKIWEIARLNRLRKAQWIKIHGGRIWLTEAGVMAMPVWLDYSLTQDAKRSLKKQGIPILKHRILVCHNSEKHRFSEHKLAHIATRISAVVEFEPANLADCQLYLNELCEVSVDEGVAKQVLTQSRGCYRLMYSACSTLEALAGKLGKSILTEADIKGYLLCEDAMKALSKRGPA